MLAQQQYEQKEYQLAATTYASVLKATQDDSLQEKALYKLGWSLFQQERYSQAEAQFDQQVNRFSGSPLYVDALFMKAECRFKQEDYTMALEAYRKARSQLESAGSQASASEQVKSLVYLHGAQSLRELEDWAECERWLRVIVERYPESPYMGSALYELGYCLQQQNQIEQALRYYSEVADNYRTEIGARARFMMGELYFAQRDFAKAIPQFQRVMYGFGGDRAPDEIKNWQVKSAFEAARCSEILIENLRGSARDKVIEAAQEFYGFIVQKHAAHELAARAQSRLGELQKLR